MTISSTKRFAILLLNALHLTSYLASAQSCYFPGGAVDNDSGVCGDSSVCCPLSWECISNGLCYLPAQEFFQRSSCTDKSWGDDCPQMCLRDDSGPENGNQAVQQCSDGRYCCDRNRPEVDEDDASKSCCVQKVRFIDIEDGTATATISTKAGSSTKASSASSTKSTRSSTSSSPSSSTSDSHSTSSGSTSSMSTASSSRPPQTSVITTQATTTNSQGEATTIMVMTTALVDPLQESSIPPHAHERQSNSSTIVGIAVGVPLGLIVASVLAFFLWRHRRKNKSAPSDPPTSERKDLVDMYGSNTTHDGKRPEADGYPVAASSTKPGHLSQAISEMSGSPVTRQQYSPHSAVSPITTGSFSNHNLNPPTANGLGFVPEEQPQELWGGDIPRQQHPQPQPQPQDFTPMGPRPMPYGGGSYPGQPVPYQPAPAQSAQQMSSGATEAARKSGEGGAGGQYSAFQGVSELPSSERPPVETAQSPPPGEDQGRIGKGLSVVNQ